MHSGTSFAVWSASLVLRHYHFTVVGDPAIRLQITAFWQCPPPLPPFLSKPGPPLQNVNARFTSERGLRGSKLCSRPVFKKKKPQLGCWTVHEKPPSWKGGGPPLHSTKSFLGGYFYSSKETCRVRTWQNVWVTQNESILSRQQPELCQLLPYRHHIFVESRLLSICSVLWYEQPLILTQLYSLTVAHNSCFLHINSNAICCLPQVLRWIDNQCYCLCTFFFQPLRRINVEFH